MYQTSNQNPAAIRLGSCKVEVEAWPPTWEDMTDLGIAAGPAMRLLRNVMEYEPENAPKIVVEERTDGAEIDVTLKEWTLATLNLLQGGTLSEVEGTPVASATRIVTSGAWDYDEVIWVASAPTVAIASVAGTVNTTLVEETDYRVVTNAAGQTGVVMIDSETVTTKVQALTITYGYTPNASKTLKFGSAGRAPQYVGVRLTNTNATGKRYQYGFYKALVSGGFEHKFPKDGDPEPAGLPLKIVAYVDSTRPTDDDIFWISDEQAV